MKKLFYLIVLMAAIVVPTTKAATVAGGSLTNWHWPYIIETPVVLQSITLWSTSTVPSIVRLYDGNIVYTNVAYTNVTTAAADVVTTYVTSAGVTNNFTNTTVQTTFELIAASTNNASTALTTLVVPASGETITYNIPYSLKRALTLSNNISGLSYVITYRNP